jgi:very-short-patch-repair endonuclease
MKNQIHNKPILKPIRKKLRKNLTPAEATLWRHLQRSQLDGRKFRRQHSVGNYVLDFYCPEEKLCVELDGAGHFTNAGVEYDNARTAYLNSVGITVVRFENKLVFKSLESVLAEITSKFKTTQG